jgi:hypothetical protein
VGLYTEKIAFFCCHSGFVGQQLLVETFNCRSSYGLGHLQYIHTIFFWQESDVAKYKFRIFIFSYSYPAVRTYNIGGLASELPLVASPFEKMYF